MGPPRHSRSVTTFLVQKCPLLDQYFQKISRIIHATLSESYNYEYNVTASGSDLYHIIHNPRIEFVSLLYVFGMYLCDKQQRSLPRNIRQHHATRKLAAANHAMVSLLYRMPYCSLFSGSHTRADLHQRIYIRRAHTSSDCWQLYHIPSASRSKTLR